MRQNLKRETFDFDNFLSPKSIQEFRDSNTDNSAKMLNMWKCLEVWKPDKLVLNKVLFKDVIDQLNEK